MRLGLRARATVAFAATALAVSAALAFAAYAGSRNVLLDEAEESARRQTYVNARAIRTAMRSRDVNLQSLLSSLEGNGAVALVRARGEWFGSSIAVDRESVPADLLEAVTTGSVGYQRTKVGDDLYVVVGVPLPAVNASYFEFSPLGDVGRTLDALARSLVVGAVVAALAGAGIGYWSAGRVVQPVRTVADAAAVIAGGRLDTRLDAKGDPDLDPLVVSFNEMVDALAERIERERRFATDVSHELQAPLAAMASGIRVARRRRDDPVAAEEALDVIEEKVGTFTALVQDLLELARAEAGVASVVKEPVDPVRLTRGVLETMGKAGHVELVVEPAAPAEVALDRRRVGQMLMTMIDNADRYAGGATRVVVTGTDGVVRLCVDDAGPGVPEHERSMVFERFARGETVSVHGPGGTGLGLALVAEHARLQGGRVWIEDSPDGGARFVVEVPA